MIDFHSHILPGADDGAKSSAEAVEMLGESYQQGVRMVVSTSHCYITEEESISRFLEKRKHHAKRLFDALAETDAPMPEIRLGAEVHMERDFSYFRGVEELCIVGTNYILVEMPYQHWGGELFDCLYSLKVRGFRPVLAHIERYIVQDSILKQLEELEVYFQFNAESFLRSPEKRFLTRLYEKNMIHFLGSDMHDPISRPTYMQAAKEAIQKKYGMEFWAYLENNAVCALKNQPIEIKTFPKLGFWERFK